MQKGKLNDFKKMQLDFCQVLYLETLILEKKNLRVFSLGIHELFFFSYLTILPLGNQAKAIKLCS